MENFELIDDYITGRLTGAEKEAFEQQLKADPSLGNDVALQQQIIDGVKKARVTELKTMLNNVPVTGAMHGGLSAGQIAAGVITASIIATSTWLYIRSVEKEEVTQSVKIELPKIENTEKPAVPNETTTQPNSENTSVTVTEPSKEKKKTTARRLPNRVQPKIEVVDPTDELTKDLALEKEKSGKSQPVVTASRIAVETSNANKKYTFHYQFSQGKLLLFGSFDKSLYEILEVNGNTHSVFLFYKESYYLLNERQTTIAPLVPIKDVELIKKLNEYRGR